MARDRIKALLDAYRPGFSAAMLAARAQIFPLRFVFPLKPVAPLKLDGPGPAMSAPVRTTRAMVVSFSRTFQ